MSERILEKAYDPKEVEDRLYKFWLDKGYFHAAVNLGKKPYTIVIPPPNVTDRLHIGHAFNNTHQDILIRFQKMRGLETEWMPGTDHAGIAMQNVVERDIAKTEKKTRHDLGREEFVKRAWAWKEKYGSIIIEQLKKIGCACDWERTRFTMDDGLSKAVAEVFVRLYKKGLIYRGKYIINWCPRCLTALSDEEVEQAETRGKLWFLKYPIEGTKKFITVATTRPETILGDVAVAVHPQDQRYTKLVSKQAILPILKRRIPIIADPMVDKEFGTGAVKITPAHDANDFAASQRHNLIPILVMNENATINANGGPYEGQDRFVARKNVVALLEREGLVEHVENHTHALGRCYRCDTVIEPYLSDQWFVKMKPLAEPALEAVRSGSIKFHPARWEKVYANWMENIRDWCISRQLWWGHRIPVWYNQASGEIYCETTPPRDAENWRQDPDVLDTWFSSWLWPFSTFGWPEQKAELKYFYPGDTLVTAHEIIFFWVARMIMAGIEFMGDVPFKDVYFTGIVRDAQGQKMSKSRGNGIDPLVMVEKYSADAVRFSLMMLSSEGNDINLADKDFEIGRNFTNKVWNAYRFLFPYLDARVLEEATIETLKKFHEEKRFELVDRWMLSRFTQGVERITTAIENFHFHDAVNSAYILFWRDYCDWYLELIKPRLNGEDVAAKEVAATTAAFVFKGLMKLLHPVVPFITEAIWQEIGRSESESIMISAWPQSRPEFADTDAERDFALLQELIGAIRNIRGEMNVPVGKTADVLIAGNGQYAEIISGNTAYFKHLARVNSIRCQPNLRRPKLAASAVVKNLELFVPLAGLINVKVERVRLEKERARIEKILESLNTHLHSHEFLAKAPEAVVTRERQKKSELEVSLNKVESNLAQLVE